MVCLTDEERLALFPAGTIVRDPNHRESPTHHQQGLNLHRTSGLVEGSCAVAITTTPRRNTAIYNFFQLYINLETY